MNTIDKILDMYLAEDDPADQQSQAFSQFFNHEEIRAYWKEVGFNLRYPSDRQCRAMVNHAIFQTNVGYHLDTLREWQWILDNPGNGHILY